MRTLQFAFMYLPIWRKEHSGRSLQLTPSLYEMRFSRPAQPYFATEEWACAGRKHALLSRSPGSRRMLPVPGLSRGPAHKVNITGRNTEQTPVLDRLSRALKGAKCLSIISKRKAVSPFLSRRLAKY
jgi:hypothetical protein